MRNALIVGGGIGGLTAAAALAQSGWRVAVAERAPSLEPVGAAIGIAPNALRALDVLGLGDAVRDLAALRDVPEAGMRRPDGAWLARTDGAAMLKRFGDPVAVLPRADLVRILTDALDAAGVTVRTGTAVTALADPGGPDAPAAVTTEDGARLDAELLVAADGVHSRLRAALWPDHPGPAPVGTVAWRALLPAPAAGTSYGETWGPRRLFGIVPLADGRVYVYATADAAEEHLGPAKLFAGWHAPVPELAEALETGLDESSGRTLRNEILEAGTPLPALHRGRTAVLGDAAHAMRPNMGQGGCMAIEDALVLAHEVGGDTAADPEAVPAALAGYTAARLPRTTRVVRSSRRAAALSAHPLGGLLAAAGARLAPSAAYRQMDAVLKWQPPQAG
ncbi:hypothetical protein BIV57_22025 [Mangrovactinospora gilvigrisea]|uniref:FAD-binding domain-containing protein n=1 Tax=Mangrovactinospora gilvigrisea TaxID=1428644 RepID=A0A1J7C6Q7_9ACTN|nr:FAD-dependent oxidoreductase [Mangrovactinospora gilvigrisea]OIV35330.1 hypothetical protein BIV57_22025 [Mangrovactinospora gilvigrisea]